MGSYDPWHRNRPIQRWRACRTQSNTKADRESKKQICQIFANNNLKITADANKKVVNFLDVILDLNTGRFKPVKPSVPNHLPLRFTFTANRTTHPTSLETYPKQLTGGYQAFPSDDEVFNEGAALFQEALRKSGYTFKLEFKPPPQKECGIRSVVGHIIDVVTG